MRRVDDPVQHRVPQVDVGRGHVDPGPQHARAVGELAGAHALEEVEALLDRPVAPGAVPPRLGERAAVLADLVGGEVVHVGLAGPDEVDGPLVELLEVVRGEVQVLAPVEPQPADVGLDGVDVLLLFLDGVRVVEAQVAAAAELPGDAEVEADRLRVADVEVTVRLRGKRVTTVWCRPSRRSAATISRMKSPRSGEDGVWLLTGAEDSTGSWWTRGSGSWNRGPNPRIRYALPGP